MLSDQGLESEPTQTQDEGEVENTVEKELRR